MADFDIRVVVDPSSGVRGVQRVGNELRKTERVASAVGRRIAAALAAAFAGVGIAASLKAFSNIEQGLIGVAKTADLTAKEMIELRDSVTEVSRVLPFARTELLAIAQAAGQLGVKGVTDLALFSETIAKLGTASDIAGAEAATALVRILNITREGVGSVDVLASVIVRLGNNFATGEAQILRMGNEVARATALFGVSSTEAVAMGTALASLGVRAELGGSSVGRAFFAIQESISEGGDALISLSNLTGVAIDDLKQAFEEDAVDIFQKFIEGLGGLGGASEITKALDAFGLKGQEVLKVLPVLALGAKDFASALAAASDEQKENAALNEEVARVMETSATAGQLLTNALLEIVEAVGEALTPAFKDAADSVREFIIEALEGETLPAIFDAIGIAAQGSVDGIRFLSENTEILSLAIALLIARQIGLAASSQAAGAAMAFVRSTAAALAISMALAGTTTTAASVGMSLMGGAAAGARKALVLLTAAFGGTLGLAAAIGVAVFAIGTYISRANDISRTTSTLAEKIAELSGEFEDQGTDVDELIDKLKELNRVQLVSEISRQKIALLDLESASEKLEDQLGTLIRSQRKFGDSFFQNREAANELRKIVREYEKVDEAGGDTTEIVIQLADQLTLLGEIEVAGQILSGLAAIGDAADLAAASVQRVATAELILAGIGGTQPLSQGRRDRELADVTDPDKPKPIKPTDGTGTSFKDILRDLEREVELVGLSNAEREERIEIFRAEEALEKKLTATQRERIEGLVAERQELENQEAIADRLADLETEGDLLRLTRREREVAIEVLALEEQLYRKLTDAERVEIETRKEGNRLLAAGARLREQFTGGFEDIDESRAALFEDETLSANAFRNALLDLDLAEMDLRIRLGDGTFADGFISGMIRMTESAQNFAAESGEIFSEFIGKFSEGFGDAFSGAILGTEKLGVAMKSVARNAIGQLISALIQMGIQYVALQVVGSAAGSAAAAVSAGEAALVAAAWAPAAAAVSLASYGANAAPAGIGIATVFALVAALAAAAGAFLFLEHGGLVSGPGTGTSDSVRTMLSRGEFVVNAAQTAKFRPILEQMNKGNSLSDIIFGEVGQKLALGGLVQGPQSPGDRRTFDLISGGADSRTAEILGRQNIPGLSFPDLFTNPATETVTIAPTFVFQSREAVDEFRETESATMAQLGRVIEESTRRRQVRRRR